jgi:hypothetical protein
LKVNSGVNTPEQPLIMKEGIPSSPTHLEGLSRLIALLTSGISDIKILNFELNQRDILPFKIRNVLPKMMGIVSETIIYKF